MPEKIYDRESEAFGRLEAQREAEWQEKYGEKMPELCRELDEILTGKDEDVFDRLEAFIEREEIKANYNATEEIVAASIAAGVRKKEIQCGESGSILKGITSLKQLEAKLQKIRFLIYRMEFLTSGDEDEAFFGGLQEEELTMTAIVEFVIIAAVHPLQVMLRIEELFWNRKLYGREILFLEFIMQRWPGNQRLMRKLVNLYLMAGRADYAATYQTMLTEYTDMGEEEQMEAERLQEREWLLLYGDIEEEVDGNKDYE